MRFTILAALSACLSFLSAPSTGGPGPFVSALWLVQRHGTRDAADPRNDESIKAKLAKGLKDAVLTRSELEGLMDSETFDRLAGPDEKLDATEVARALAADTPESRKALRPPVLAHAELLSTSLDMIDDPHREGGAKLASWIAKNYVPGKPLHVTVICTGNSRRSILGSTMGNIASAYYGMPEVRFHSGGTAPTAFNPRTIAGLKAIGVEIEPTGEEAPMGEPKTENPVYRVRWGNSESFESVEFSKVYSDPANPQDGFAAILVCSEADAGCPVVKGAAIRVPMPFLDPKAFDASPFESAKYAERRDDIGRVMMSALMSARNEIARGRKSPGS